ncbi:MAG TPA: serine/threonine-protein kinase, partial [Kofleriaceae bacterium]|nr:serine/threonine-protein kinase [Kofleriaceae bacterium]
MTCPACGKDVLDIDVKCGSCGAALGSTGAHRMIGSVMLGQYELVDVLGQGGMSTVFKGRHKLTDQEVALKILPPELAAHSQVKSRFLEEAKALAALDHANIVHLYNFGQENGYFVLAMQLVQGQTWERMILESTRLDWPTSCRIAIDVLRALEYAHGAGVIHRDMKPSNVLVRSRDGVATVMDFGIAKMTTSTRLTATGQTMGTVRYMSPEQVRGQEVDLRTDLYSLGATLYESLVGDTPFDGSTHFEIMTKHLSTAPVAPSRRGVTLPREVDDAVMRCLAKKAEDRFSGAREMRKILEAALRDGDVGLIETQRLDRGGLGELRGTAVPVAPPASSEEVGADSLAGDLAAAPAP